MKEPDECEVTTVDRFIDDRNQDNYARWCLLLMRFPSSYLVDFEHQLNNSKLFCTYGGKRWQVVHASPHGYIKIQTGLPGESATVSPFECTEWDSVAHLRPMVRSEAFALVETVVELFEAKRRSHGILRTVEHTDTSGFFGYAAYLLNKLCTDVNNGAAPWNGKK